MSRSVFGWDLPPGVTTQMIEDAAGVGEETCDAQSPDGQFACTYPPDHDSDHAHTIRAAAYKQVSCADPACPRRDVELGIVCHDENAPPGTWWLDETYVKIAVWPQREDDFTDGEPTPRKDIVFIP
jgi:hypothetical protein